MQIRFCKNDDSGTAIVESSRNFEYSSKTCGAIANSITCGDIAKYMVEQMFTESMNAHVADRVFANHLAIETRLLQSKFRIRKAELDKNRAFAN